MLVYFSWLISSLISFELTIKEEVSSAFFNIKLRENRNFSQFKNIFMS